MTRFRNYRIESTRMPNWDYTRGWYFITICTQHKQPYFGSIKNHIMRLSCTGDIVAEEWERSALLRPLVRFDAWIIMPDHFHAIVRLQKQQESPESTPSPLPWKPGVPGAVAGQFKAACTKRIRRECISDFAWHSRYYERCIHNYSALQAIRYSIMGNPLRAES